MSNFPACHNIFYSVLKNPVTFIDIFPHFSPDDYKIWSMQALQGIRWTDFVLNSWNTLPLKVVTTAQLQAPPLTQTTVAYCLPEKISLHRNIKCSMTCVSRDDCSSMCRRNSKYIVHHLMESTHHLMCPMFNIGCH